MIFRQLFERESSTYTYLIGCEQTRQAVLIDTVKSQLDQYLQLLDELNLRLVYVLDTHTHADHITAAGALRDATGASTLLGEEKANNPRLQVKDLAEYVALMNNLKLPNPKMMDIAVPANKACGKI